MNSRPDILVIALLMLLGFSPIWTKRVISRSEGDFSKYYQTTILVHSVLKSFL